MECSIEHLPKTFSPLKKTVRLFPEALLGACPYGVASRSCCATQESVGDRVTPTWITFRDFSSMMKNACERSKEEIGDLQEVASPDLCGVSVHKGCPFLTSWLG